MAGIKEYIENCSALNDLSRVHNTHIIRNFRNHAEIVRDKNDGEPPGSLNALQKIKNALLYGHIKSRSRFITDQEFRILGQGDFITLLSGSTTVDQIRENAQSAQLELDPEDVAMMRDMAEALDK